MSTEEEIPLEAMATASELAAAAAAAEPADEAQTAEEDDLAPDPTPAKAEDDDAIKAEETETMPHPPDPPASLASPSPHAAHAFAPLPMMTEQLGGGVVSTGQENTGRWTKVEHAAFLKGIEKYGKEWKKVAILVKTRTVMQTRTHAQKYFEKLAQIVAKQNGTPAGKISTSISSTKRLDNKEAKEKKKATATLKSPPRSSLPATFTSPTSPAPIVSFTDTDILVPISDSTALRSANKEYMDLMKANCFIFHSLPLAEQAWFVRNLVNFITVVRGRRWVACNFYHPNTAPQYQLLPDPTTVVQNDFRMDPLKIAGFAFHPFWLLGEHDPGNAHNGMPFLHRTIDGSWKAVTTSQVRDILKGEGPKNLLLMPPTVHLEAASTGIPTAAAASTPAEARTEVKGTATNAEETEDVPDLPPATMDDPVEEVPDPNDIAPDDAATAAALAVTLHHEEEEQADDDAVDESERVDVEEDETGKTVLTEGAEDVEAKKVENKRGGAKRSVAQKSLPVTRKVHDEEDDEEEEDEEEEEVEVVEEKGKGRATRGAKRGVKDGDEGEKTESPKKASRASAKKEPEPETQRRSKRQRG